MANLTYRDQIVLEELFEMQDGYVMDFSNSTFEKFILKTVSIEVYSNPEYSGFTSKAKKLRHLWEHESDYTVGILLEALLEYCENRKLKTQKLDEYARKLIRDMREVAKRLKGGVSFVELPQKEDADFQTLQNEINRSLAEGKPELALDRLHTFVTKLLQEICLDNGIEIKNENGKRSFLPLHGLAGKLKKKYTSYGVFKANFTLKAIENCISLFEDYNDIRNGQSYAHPNPVLHGIEAEFAIKVMSDFILFIDRAENYRKQEMCHSEPTKN